MIGRRRYRAEPKRRAVVPSRARVLASAHNVGVGRGAARELERTNTYVLSISDRPHRRHILAQIARR